LSDEIARQRRELPWARVEKEYAFHGLQGKLSLADLFDGRSQLATYHFMFGPDWKEGCPGCSYVMDHVNGAIEHLRARDVSLVAVSRGPIEQLAAFKKAHGLAFCLGFVRRLPIQSRLRRVIHAGRNCQRCKSLQLRHDRTTRRGESGPEFFLQGPSGNIFHTYSTYGRGLEAMLGTYVILDRASKGRDEEGLPMPMAWVRHHDKYEPTVLGVESCCHKSDDH